MSTSGVQYKSGQMAVVSEPDFDSLVGMWVRSIEDPSQHTLHRFVRVTVLDPTIEHSREHAAHIDLCAIESITEL